MPKILLIMCVWGIFPLTTDQFPVVGGFNLLLYPYGSHALLIPVSTVERRQTPQANSSATSSQSLSSPSNANGAFFQPEVGSGPAPNSASLPGPAPDRHTAPFQSSVQQPQNLIPSNIPLQVYAFVQQTVISDSGSSEEGDTAQVVYMVPVRVESPSMDLMESTAPAPVPDPGPLHVPVTSSATTGRSRAAGETLTTGTAAPTDVRGKRQL